MDRFLNHSGPIADDGQALPAESSAMGRIVLAAVGCVGPGEPVEKLAQPRRTQVANQETCKR